MLPSRPYSKLRIILVTLGVLIFIPALAVQLRVVLALNPIRKEWRPHGPTTI